MREWSRCVQNGVVGCAVIAQGISLNTTAWLWHVRSWTTSLYTIVLINSLQLRVNVNQLQLHGCRHKMILINTRGFTFSDSFIQFQDSLLAEYDPRQTVRSVTLGTRTFSSWFCSVHQHLAHIILPFQGTIIFGTNGFTVVCLGRSVCFLSAGIRELSLSCLDSRRFITYEAG